MNGIDQKRGAGRGVLRAMPWLFLGIPVVLGLHWLDAYVVNVVNYRVDASVTDTPWLSWTVSLSALAALGFVAFHRRRVNAPLGVSRGAIIALAVSALIASAWLAGATTPSFTSLCAMLVGVGCAIDFLGAGVTAPAWIGKFDRAAPWALAVAIAGSTFWHAAEQVHLWRAFMLGYADFGFFVTDLEHCLPWKDAGSSRFLDVRMGYHCLPFFYLLAPFYAIFRSPVFLMVVGPLALNLAAWPFYQLAKHRSGSAVVGLIVGLAWLLLPSMSRLPYSNTYGFQNIYLAVPWLALSFTLAHRERWTGSWVALVIAMACEETVCGVALGWGVYLLLDKDRRRQGLALMIVSMAYLLFATLVVIPWFAESGRYTRVDLIGNEPWPQVLARFGRPRESLYLLALAAPLLPSLLRAPRVLLAAVPTLLLVLLLRWEDYLSVKFWHQSSILPVLFLAATLGATGVKRVGQRGLGPPLALLVGVFLFHYLMADSPLGKARYERLARTVPGRTNELRAAVDFVRGHYPASGATVLATQRLAAHFTDYRMVFPAQNAAADDPRRTPDVCVIDRRDLWDEVGHNGGLEDLIAGMRARGFETTYDRDGVVVLARAAAPKTDPP